MSSSEYTHAPCKALDHSDSCDRTSFPDALLGTGTEQAEFPSLPQPEQNVSAPGKLNRHQESGERKHEWRLEANHTAKPRFDDGACACNKSNVSLSSQQSEHSGAKEQDSSQQLHSGSSSCCSCLGNCSFDSVVHCKRRRCVTNSSSCCLQHQSMSPLRSCHPRAEMRGDCAERRLPKWEKILWKKQPHPDSYVDETFLNTLMRNANLTRYIYADLCKSTVVLTQHLSCILIFLLIYRMIMRRSIEATKLVLFDVIALPLGYALRWFIEPAPRAARQVLQSAVIVFGVLRVLAPVLQTLTQSFSDDTVLSMTAICLLIHIPLNDYSYIHRNPGIIDEPLGRLMSLNVAVFASVLLASRLNTSTEVFAFMFFGIEVFALSPMARRYLLLWNPWAFTYIVTPLLILLTATLLYIEGSASNVILYIFMMFFITFVGPYWLIRSQKYKNEISGPWDIPCVRNYT